MAIRFEVFKGAMATLGLTFNREPGPLMDAYWAALKDLGDDELTRAFGRALSECKFFPVPAELREFARPERALADRAASAWAAVRIAIRKHDYTVASIDFGPLVNTALRAMGSWEWLCGLGDNEMQWQAKNFTRYFEAFATGPTAALRAEPLEGWGRGRIGCEDVPFAIEGEAAPARLALASKGGGALSSVVRELAEAKALGAPGAPPPAPVCYRCEWAASDCACPEGPLTNKHAIPPRERKTPAKITEDEKAAALARMTAQVDARKGAA